MDYTAYITSDASVLLGKPVIKGTRIPVELIIQRLAEGATAAQLTEAYQGLTPEGIQAVLAYASDVISTEQIIAVV